MIFFGTIITEIINTWKLTSINILNYSLHKEYITIEFIALSSRSIISDFLNLLVRSGQKKLSTVFLDFTK